MTRLGDFWKFLETNVTLKLAQILGNFLGDFDVSHFLRKKPILVTFWASIENFGLRLIPTSGHTGCEIRNERLSYFKGSP